MTGGHNLSPPGEVTSTFIHSQTLSTTFKLETRKRIMADRQRDRERDRKRDRERDRERERERDRERKREKDHTRRRSDFKYSDLQIGRFFRPLF